MNIFYCILFMLLAAISSAAQGDSLRIELLNKVRVTASRAQQKNLETAGPVPVITAKTLQAY